MLGHFRLLLALGVLFAHMGKMEPEPARTMVSSFFVLSGYLITLTLNRNYSNVGAFYWNRFLRLYPLHTVMVLAVVVGVALGRPYAYDFDGNDIAPALLFKTKEAFHINAPSWSLTYEVLFYLIAPFVVYHKARIAAIAMVSILTIAFTGYLGTLTEGFMVSRGWDIFRPITIPASMVYFMLGAGLYYAPKLPQWTQRIWAPALALMVWLATLYVSIYWAVMVLTVLVVLSSGKESKWSTLAGDLCYPVYMIHWPLIQFHLSGNPRTLTFYTLTLALAWVFIERRWIRDLRALKPSWTMELARQSLSPNRPL